MHFPVVFRIGGVTLPAHVLFESLAYAVGFRVYLASRVRAADPISDTARLSLLAAAAVGAVVGSKLLEWAQHAPDLWAHRDDPAAWLGGKSIVGGLLGGWLAIEIVKRLGGERRRTGDVYVLPLCVAIAIGRVGCFLAGMPDRTYGNPTTLPWGVDFGDGLRRHPTQIYEIVVVSLIGLWALAARRRVATHALQEGDVFRGFMSLYLLFRLALETLKPAPHLMPGLSAIQIACVLGILYLLRDWPRLLRSAPSGGPAVT